jgi:hypothetical protein
MRSRGWNGDITDQRSYAHLVLFDQLVVSIETLLVAQNKIFTEERSE